MDAASIDLKHDTLDRTIKVSCPLLLLWSEKGLIGKHFKPIDIWQNWATNIQRHAMGCGHFIPEELPDETCQIVHRWIKD